ncbi:hypothetical protein IG631_13129 [Alternaria alternata]|nr:hypothetical protein IG631_13129 [Alternaria alternata]
MQLFLPFLALLSTLASAAPVVELQTRQSGAGGIIFKDQNFKGESTFIPGNLYCTDVNNIFGNFDGKVRSIKSLPGYQCQWYIVDLHASTWTRHRTLLQQIIASCADVDLLRPTHRLPKQCAQVSESESRFQSVRNESLSGISRTTLRHIQNTKFKNEELEDLRAITGSPSLEEYGSSHTGRDGRLIACCGDHKETVHVPGTTMSVRFPPNAISHAFHHEVFHSAFLARVLVLRALSCTYGRTDMHRCLGHISFMALPYEVHITAV